MQRTRNLRPHAAALVAFVALACGPLQAAADPQITGSQTAWQSLSAAFQKLLGQRSYKMQVHTATPAGSGMMTWTIAGPDTYAISLLLDSGSGEDDVTVDGETRHRGTTANLQGPWQCGPGALPTDPEGIADFVAEFQGTIAVSQSPDTTIDGAAVHAYAVSTTAAGATINATIYVDAATGLPRRAISGTSVLGQPTHVTIDYYDYGVPVALALPACT